MKKITSVRAINTAEAPAAWAAVGSLSRIVQNSHAFAAMAAKIATENHAHPA
jgi:hypothetical protein